jgi:hypothetical protein
MIGIKQRLKGCKWSSGVLSGDAALSQILTFRQQLVNHLEEENPDSKSLEIDRSTA